ncbi:glycosyltransferase [Deinococcus apachensis]|uniref:glycosyltransferase n=1 Tax=Deinococcus apachensis TaxID=309886 RepID=UPI000377C5C9|nr:glycosyltransferase [Deinococcus apachensis]
MRYVFALLDTLGLLLLCLYLVQMTLAATLPRPRREQAPDPRLRFTVLIPALNEEEVIAATVRSVRTLAPEARMAVIDDGSDDGTAALVGSLADDDPAVRLLRRFAPHARQGKGRALNWAVRRLIEDLHSEGRDPRQDIFVILDADGRLAPGLLPEARRAFADPLVMGAQAHVQVRMSGIPSTFRGWIGRMLELEQDIEYFIIRHVQQLRERWHGVALFGNGQFMRASYLAGQFERGRDPWPDCLSEDLASGLELRLADPRFRLAFLESAVTQQGLPDLGRFTRQRARWVQGTMQCGPYIPRLWRAPVSGLARLDLSYFLSNPWTIALVLLSLLTQPVRLLFGERGLVLDPTVATTLTGLNLALQAHWVARYRRQNPLNAAMVGFAFGGLFVYGFAIFSSLPRAYWNYFTRRHVWDKSVRHAEAPEIEQPQVVPVSSSD